MVDNAGLLKTATAAVTAVAIAMSAVSGGSGTLKYQRISPMQTNP
jgi:hypothetical protein